MDVPKAPAHADILGWDVRTWSPALDCWAAAIGERAAPMRCLEVGAGPGGPSLWLASLGHEVVCTNLADTEAQAAPLHRRFGVGHRVEYRDIDLREGLPFRDDFDVVVFKSVLGGLGDDPAFARDVMAQIHAALRPGGHLLFAENTRGGMLHRGARRLAYRIRRSSWRYPTLAELDGLLAGYRDVRMRVGGVAAVFGPTEGIRDVLARLDRAVLERLAPRDWHYMAYGTARR